MNVNSIWVTIIIAFTITSFSFWLSYLITQYLAKRRLQSTEAKCSACHSTNLTVIHLVAPQSANSLIYCISEKGYMLEALWGMRCEECGHVNLYSVRHGDSEKVPTYPPPHPSSF